jgi:hypothetical protein
MTTLTDQNFDTKFDYFDTARSELGLTAVWSIFEVDNLNETHPFVGVTKVIYKTYGSGDAEVAIDGNTWKALYIAADTLISESGDNHHIFIEDFKQSSINPEILFVTTGS